MRIEVRKHVRKDVRMGVICEKECDKGFEKQIVTRMYGEKLGKILVMNSRRDGWWHHIGRYDGKRHVLRSSL